MTHADACCVLFVAWTKKKGACVGEEEERETASQMNQPTNQVKQRACVCEREEEMRKKRKDKRKREGC